MSAFAFKSFRSSLPDHRTRTSTTRCHTSTYEVRICTNKTCSRQGSKQIFSFGKDLALPTVAVEECGCLGSCGNGPNIAILPYDITSNGSRHPAAPLLLRHISTPAKLADVLTAVCEASIDAKVLKCTELRLAGNSAAMGNDFKRAIQCYTEALELGPPHGKHMLLANRSAAHLSTGNAENALEDAIAAAECCPNDFTTAGIRQADALFALGRLDEALRALQAAAERHPPFGRSQEFKNIQKAIQKSVDSIVKA